MPSSAVGAAPKRMSRSPRRAANSHSVRTDTERSAGSAGASIGRSKEADRYSTVRNHSSISADMTLTRRHHQRLRDLYRSAGWPCRDMLEVELLAAGLVARVVHPDGNETMRVTDAGVALLAEVLQANRAARTAHEALVERVAIEMGRAGRLAWRGLNLRARIEGEAEGNTPAKTAGWCIACPDVF